VRQRCGRRRDLRRDARIGGRAQEHGADDQGDEDGEQGADPEQHHREGDHRQRCLHGAFQSALTEVDRQVENDAHHQGVEADEEGMDKGDVARGEVHGRQRDHERERGQHEA